VERHGKVNKNARSPAVLDVEVVPIRPV